ncbi:MAG: type II secretion system protein GspD [bacterium]
MVVFCLFPLPGNSADAPAAGTALYQRDEKTGLLPDGAIEGLTNLLKDNRMYQVFIEVNIFEVLIRDEDDIGFVYDLLGEIGRVRGTSLAGENVIESDLGVLGSGTRDVLLPAGANIVARVFDSDEGEIHAVIQALAEDQIVKVHANPIILTVENVPARLESGEDVPYLERVSLGDVETVVSTYRQTGVSLEVTPDVKFFETDVQRKNPYITLDVTADLSNVSRFREEEGFTQPIVDTRNYTTTVEMQSGSRVVIASLFRDSYSPVSRGIPLLKDIPLLGRLFRSTQTSSVVSQLYIIIRPVIFDIWSEQPIIDQERAFRQDYQSMQDALNSSTEEMDVTPGPFEQFKDLMIERSGLD